jgi:tetratricopeptide (TPR) repeat protein/cellulose biosynthesis protein BcsQ
MFTVTFYSYKGGVGRTLAIANVADRLSAMGKRVFLLDFDLEAPGLDAYFPKVNQGTPGIVEYVSRYAETEVVPPLKDYVTEVRAREGQAAGTIFLMRSGLRNSEYQRLLAHMNWKDFYTHRHGFLFVENLKGAIESDYRPDYILVDSRTGLTDISGICTLQLPDAVVFLFGLNDQNLEGTATIYKSVVSNKLNKSIETLLVATPVPEVPDFLELKEQRLAKAKELIGRPVDLTLPLAPFVAFQETFVPKSSGTFLSELYTRLTDKIIGMNKFDVLSMLKNARKLKSGDPEQAMSAYKEILGVYPQNSKAWQAYGVFLRNTRDPKEALGAFENAIKYGGEAEGWADLALTYLSLGEFEPADSNFRVFLDKSHNCQQIMFYTSIIDRKGRHEAAIAGYERALELCGDDIQATTPLNELGNLFMARKEYEKAVPLYERALTIEPTALPMNYNLGYALHLVSQQEKSHVFLRKAVDIYEQTSQRNTPKTLANNEQAIGNSCAILGLPAKAAEHFMESLKQASLATGPILSSIRYMYLSPDEFKEETLKLMSALQPSQAEITTL